MTRDQLRTQYRSEKSEQEKLVEFFSYAIYRPISFQVTPLFLALGLSATAVTMVGVVLSVVMPLGIWVVPGPPYLWLAAASLCWLVLDCVDGNIARIENSASSFGQYMDSLAGKIYHVFLSLSLGLVAAQEWPIIAPGYWLVVASSLPLLRLWSRESRSYFKLNFMDRPAPFASGRLGWRNLLLSAQQLTPFSLLVLGPFGMVHLWLFAVLGLEVAAFFFTQRMILRQLRV